MYLSVIIGTHNEAAYIPALLDSLTRYKASVPYDMEIIVVDDFSTDPVVQDAFNTHRSDIVLHTHAVDGDYGRHKTIMNSFASAPWILNLDADETISEDLFINVQHILNNNAYDVYALPRVNIVDGMPLSYLRQWGVSIHQFDDITSRHTRPIDSDVYALWRTYKLIVSETDTEILVRDPLIAWPDYQSRLYRNDPRIVWTRKVHEQLHGYTSLAQLPASPEFAIWHRKTFLRQQSQNASYALLGG